MKKVEVHGLAPFARWLKVIEGVRPFFNVRIKAVTS
ncbi:hypothetical protein predicted by Glimmer/Critica [Limosilactobacillus fermentum]|nr:hypothetical protein predicted by Glimmer/Critica [Limosilactobacillus fermentum]